MGARVTEFEPGDVVMCFNDKGEHRLNGIIMYAIDPQYPSRVRCEVLRPLHPNAKWWTGHLGWPRDEVKLHPDPDLIWAEYAAWVLLEGSN
jgi:hypothetical protein